MAKAFQLIRTDDSVPGIVKFYDRRQAEVGKAFIAEVDVMAIEFEGEVYADQAIDPKHPCIRAAVHGYTQNILDASNKLSGDERVAYIREMCARVQAGGWASAPVDEGAALERAIVALVKIGFTRAEAERRASQASLPGMTTSGGDEVDDNQPLGGGE